MKYHLILIVTTAMLDIWIKNENGMCLGVNIGSKDSSVIPLMLWVLVLELFGSHLNHASEWKSAGLEEIRLGCQSWLWCSLVGDLTQPQFPQLGNKNLLMSESLPKMFMKNKANFKQQLKKKKTGLHTVQEWVNKAGLRLSLQRPDCQISRLFWEIGT